MIESSPAGAPGRPVKILFFSKGRGRGHAVPDMVLSNALRERSRDISIAFVSYGTGAETLSEHGELVTNLNLPEANPFLETIIRSADAISQALPDLVFAHEEPAALVAARICKIPGIFITNWFIDPGSMFTKAAEYADEVIYIGQAGVFTEPPQLREKVFYCGPVIRPLEYGKSDRTRARGELGVPVDGFVLSCLSGTTYESNNPVFDLVMAAYDRLKFEPKRLIWVGSTDYDKIRARTAERPDVMAEDIDWKIERVMVASDVVITKGTCNILQELNWLGIPSISLSHGTNWVDDVLANHISSNVPLSVSRVTAGGLAERIAEQFSKSREGQWPPSKPVTNGAGKAVERLAAHVERVRALLALPPQAASSKEITT